MKLAKDIQPGDVFAQDGLVVYTVEKVRTNTEEGVIDLQVRFKGDGGEAIRRFKLDADTTLFTPDGLS